MKSITCFVALLLSGSVAVMAQKHGGSRLVEKEHTHLDPDKHRPIGGIGGRGPLVEGPVAGGTKEVTGSNDTHFLEVSEFAAAHLASENSDLSFVQVKAMVQVVAGLMYTLDYVGNDDEGVCQEKHKLVVFDRPWLNERELKSDTKAECT